MSERHEESTREGQLQGETEKRKRRRKTDGEVIPKLTASEHRYLAQIEDVRAEVALSADHENAADDMAYLLARQHFDADKDAYKPRFQNFLVKMKFKVRAKGNNKLLAVIDLTHQRLHKSTRTRRAQLIAAAVFFGKKPSELRATPEGEAGQVKIWKQETGRLKPSKKRDAQPDDKPPGREISIDDGDVSEEEIEAAAKAGDKRVAIVTLTSSPGAYLHKLVPSDDPHAAALLKGAGQ